MPLRRKQVVGDRRDACRQHLRVSADAPSNQYAPFVSADRRIIDNFTHLVWERSFSTPIVDPNIDAYCVAPTRLPTVKELLTLVDENPSKAYDQTQGKDVTVHIDQQAFAYNANGANYVRVDAPYCTQTKDTAAMTRYVVDFATGEARTIALNSATASCRARCVQFVPP